MLFFGERLREERKRLDLNQFDLANACGVTLAMYGRYERGLAVPGSEVLAKLLAEGLDVGYLLGAERRSGTSLTAEEEVLLEYFRAAGLDTRKAALRVLMGDPSQGTHSPKPESVGHISGGVNQIVSGQGHVVSGGMSQGLPAGRKRPPR